MISEIDVNDMKALYDLPLRSYFKLSPTEYTQVPPDNLDFTQNDVFKYMGVDGMHSKCYDSLGNLHHFAAWTKVVPWVTDEK